MKLLLTGRNLDVTPSLRQLVTRRVERLGRHLGDAMVSAQVVLQREKYRHVTEVVAHMRGDHVLTGLGGATTWPLSIAEACERIEQQAKRVKQKWTTRKRRATGTKGLPVPEVGETDLAATAVRAPAPAPELVRPRIYRARGALKPLTIDDAATRLDGGPDAFLVFRNSDTGRLAVVYRRKDGHVALVESES